MLAHGLCPHEFGAQFRWQLFRGGRAIDHGAIKLGRGSHVAGAMQVIRFEQQRTQIAGLEDQRPVHRGERGGIVAQRVAGVGQAQINSGVSLPARYHAFEGRAGGARIAAAERLDG
jgi:hypothetical protein